MDLVDSKLPLPAGEDFAQQVWNRMDVLQTQMERNNEGHKTQMGDLKTQVEGLKTHVEGLKTQMQEMKLANQAQMAVLLAPIAIQTAKNANRSLKLGEALVQVPNNQGVLPANLVFPQTIEDLMTMEVNHVNDLLTFYGIIPHRRDNLDQRKKLLGRHIGLNYNRN